MALNRYGATVLRSWAAVNASDAAMAAAAAIDDLDRTVRGMIDLNVTAIDATSTWSVVVYGSVDGVTFYEIVRSTAAQIATPAAHWYIPVSQMGDGGFAATPASYLPFKPSVSLGAGAIRPGIPWRMLGVRLEQVAVGGGTGITATATLYTVGEQQSTPGSA